MLQVATDFKASPHPSMVGVPVTSGTVLVVEDECLIGDVMAEALDDHGFRVLRATHAVEALTIVAAGGVDLLFTDIDLARGTSGLDLARKARLLRPDLKVVYASGGRAVLDGGDAVSCSQFVPKPYRPLAVTALLADLLA